MRYPVIKNKFRLIILPFLLLLITNTIIKAQCFTTGSVNAASFSNDASNGTIPFSNPSFAQTSDINRSTASALLTLLAGTTNYLKVSNFNASIPLTATICGIELEIEKSATGINILTSVSDGEIKMVKNGAIIGTNHAVPGKWPTSDTYFSYGSISDLWGTTLTAADVNATNFGFVISSDIVGVLALLPSARINYVRLTIYYTMLILPVKLTSFEVKKGNDNKLHFKWSVENDLNVIKYTIERSANNIDWQEMYETGRNNSEAMANYSVELPADAFNSNYYRLKIQNINGSLLYSNVKMIETVKENSFQIIPTANTLYIKNILVNNSRAVIIDMQGRKMIASQVSQGNLNRIDISILSKGIYFITIGNQTKKFIRL